MDVVPSVAFDAELQEPPLEVAETLSEIIRDVLEPAGPESFPGEDFPSDGPLPTDYKD